MAEKQSSKGAEVKPEATHGTPGASTSVQNTETPDQYMSGGQGKEQRAHLEQNSKGENAPAPEQPSGIHSTGSFTGKAERPEDPDK